MSTSDVDAADRALEPLRVALVAAADAIPGLQSAVRLAALAEAARIADQVTNAEHVARCACPPDSQRSCGWRAGANEVAQQLWEMWQDGQRIREAREVTADVRPVQ